MSPSEIVAVLTGLAGLIAAVASLYKARVDMATMRKNQHEFIAQAVRKEKTSLEHYLQASLQEANGLIADLRQKLEEVLQELAGCRERDTRKTRQIEELEAKVDALIEAASGAKPRRERRANG